MKLALAQLDVIAGRPDINAAKILTMLETARQKNADAIIFPEMAVPGYLLGDTWEQDAFLEDCQHWGQKIIDASAELYVIFGNVAIDPAKRNNDGRVRKYNAFFIARDGQLIHNGSTAYPFMIKTLHPNYREFDDTRHFYSLQQLANDLKVSLESLLKPVNINIGGHNYNVGCLICEDGWSEHYPVKPIDILRANHNIDMYINISCSPYTLGKAQKRHKIFAAQAQAAQAPLVYVNSTGIQNNGKTIYTFDGACAVYDKGGQLIHETRPYVQTLSIVNFEPKQSDRPYQQNLPQPEITHIYRALTYGAEKFLASIGVDKIVIGLSGGIDSAVAAALFCRVLPPENVLLVNMPSRHNSSTTKNLAATLAKNLGCKYMIVPIQEAVDHTIRQIESIPVFNLADGSESFLTVSEFNAENIQARDRSSRVLAAIAASFGGCFSCNANKSETTVGYSTLYGDHAGFLAVLADLWKHQVYELADYLNTKVYDHPVIDQGIIDIVPSAELSDSQSVDQGQGDPLHYPYHDYLFRAFVEFWRRATPQDILEWYIDGSLEEKLGCRPHTVTALFPTAAEFIADLERWWNLYAGMGVAKRIQAPPILAISRRAYGFDHREAQNGPYYTVKYNELKNRLLEQ